MAIFCTFYPTFQYVERHVSCPKFFFLFSIVNLFCFKKEEKRITINDGKVKLKKHVIVIILFCILFSINMNKIVLNVNKISALEMLST